MIIVTHKQKQETFKEKRLIFQEATPALDDKGFTRSVIENVPLIGGPLDTAAQFLQDTTSLLKSGTGAATIAAASAARLANSFAGLIDMTTYGISKGTSEAVDGAKRLVEWIRFHKEMEDPLDLPEYIEIGATYLYEADSNGTNILSPNHSDKQIKKLMDYDYRIAILDILLNQLKAFYEPIMDEVNRLEREIKLRDRLEFETREQRIKLETGIRSLDALIKSGHLPDAGTKAQFEIDKALKERSLKQLKQQSTKKNVKWSKPQIQMTEFPIGSGRYIPRYIPGPEVNVDIDKLRDSMSVYALGAAPFLKTYMLEKGKLVYRKNQLLEDKTINAKALTYAGDLENYKETLGKKVQKVKARKDADFKKQSLETIHYLINDTFEIKRSVATTPQSCKDYKMWKYLKELPNKLAKFGCYVSGNDIVKKNSFNVPVLFYIKPDGSIETTYPESSLIAIPRTLPVGADPNHKNAWSPPMP